MEKIGVDLLKYFGINTPYNDIIVSSILFSLVPIIIIVPYLIKRSYQYNDKVLRIIAIIFLIADAYMLYNRIKQINMENEYLSKSISNITGYSAKTVFVTLYMLIPAYILAPRIFYAGYTNDDNILIIIALAIFFVDNYHYSISK